MKRIAILASGKGSNALAIISAFKAAGRLDELGFVASDKADAPVLEGAEKLGVPTLTFTADETGFTFLLAETERNSVSLIALAGFMRLIPSWFLSSFHGRLVNIHPSLLPKHGGKGMYGARVHKAVIAAGDEKSGCTIHYVNEAYDEGEIIAQFSCRVDAKEDWSILAARVLELEHRHYPEILLKIHAP